MEQNDQREPQYQKQWQWCRELNKMKQHLTDTRTSISHNIITKLLNVDQWKSGYVCAKKQHHFEHLLN